MRTKIISAFPGMGKSTYHKMHPETTLDSDSSSFGWIVEDGEKKRNPDFPQNYMNHIKENIGKYEYIFVSSHKVVRDALKDNCLFFYLVYPNYNRKEEFRTLYIHRGSSISFCKMIMDNWDNWIDECVFEEIGCEKIMAYRKCKYLASVITGISCREGGDRIE
ncbi:MAG: hypothetical protein PQJ59_16600 [Spirochaetales bacterium]|nr:hypothetical protein [Spirochaetales bacterium]